jgi:hypothetical protein
MGAQGMRNYHLWASGAGLIASVGLVAAVQYWAQCGMFLDQPNHTSLHVCQIHEVVAMQLWWPFASSWAPSVCGCETLVKALEKDG